MKKLIGKVKHFYPKISVVAVELTGGLKVGDKICIEGHGNEVEQAVDSMQIENKAIKVAKKGDVIGLKVSADVKEQDLVYLA